ncbi:DUF4282 domain-containing protein [Desulfuromonas thiophila]|uniref:DUF4282 domain-containing protein n=1 Tax=Desulfuromonas thiophila TaxID=57664 RepID=UPI0024A9B006|nr:DUF4282 domain-containing protein [Desulfuromonas thiophila]
MLKKMLNFDEMVTPSIIKIIYYISIFAVVLTGLIQLFTGLNSSYGGGAVVFSGIVTILIGPIVVRIYCELMILLFRIYEKLCEISNTMKIEKP